MASSFRGLRAYRLAAGLAREVRSEVVAWTVFDQRSLGVQLVRSLESVAANIAEAQGRWYTGDARKFLFNARGSLYEAEHWLIQAEAYGLLKPGTAERIDEIAQPLNGLIKKPQRRDRA